MKLKHFSNFDIAGFTYYEGAMVFSKLKIGKELILKRETDNKYDPKAVAIYFGKHKLGFVPRACNSEISKLLDAGYVDIFEVRINRVTHDEVPENQIGAIVYLKKQKLIITFDE